MSAEPQEVADILDGLSTPTADEVYQATRNYDNRYISAAVGSKAYAAAGGAGPLTAEVALTNAEIIALGAGTPKTVVAAPDTDTFINFLHGIVIVDAVAVAYGSIDPAVNMYFRTGTGVSILADNNIIPYLLGGDGEVAVAWFTPAVSTDGSQVAALYADKSQVTATALTLVVSNGSVAFSGGDPGNSGRVKVWYTLEELP